jgi:hypothetical protein
MAETDRARHGLAAKSLVMRQTSSIASPPAYVALLRGINVGGHKLVKMDVLRHALQSMGLAEVSTYLQSGKVEFKARAEAPVWRGGSRKRCCASLGFPCGSWRGPRKK